MSAINATHAKNANDSDEQTGWNRRAARLAAILMLAAVALTASPTSAHAGSASTGEAAFLPCTNCHPVTVDADGKPTTPLPNGFKKHQIELEVHDILGTGDGACLACHDDPSRDPGKLHAPDGSLIDITGDVSRVCQRCHFEKYREWQVGVHGKNEPKCSSSGCHDPHTPSWIYIPALAPFQGTGIQVRAMSQREPFKPMASPPAEAPVKTPLWLSIAATIGTLIIVSNIGYLLIGRSKQ